MTLHIENRRLRPFPLTPTPPHLAWQQAELGVVFHYDLHVFDDRHYTQQENRRHPIKDIDIFNPTEFDTESRDYVYRYMQERNREFWWIENGVLPKMSSDTFRGVYTGGYQQDEYAADRYIPDVIRGRGSTHDGEFTERCGDVFPTANWPVGVLKEGDSPSFLYLLSPVLGGVGDVDDPTSESWGGSFRHFDAERFPNYYVDIAGGMEQCTATINKWRRDFLDAWTLRWNWY